MDPLAIAIGLYFLAIILAVFDVFLPSGGILLMLSGIAAVGAIIFGFRSGTTIGLVVTIIVLASIPAFLYSAIKLWPHTPIGRRILLTPPTANDTRFNEQTTDFRGTVVKNIWPLAPMGQIKIGTQRYNARSSDSRVIDPGKRVKVIDVQEGILVVAETNEPITENVYARPPATEAQQLEVDEENLLETPAAELGLNDLDELPLDDDRSIS